MNAHRVIDPIVAIGLTAWLTGCVSEPALQDDLEPSAVQAAQQRGASELECSMAMSKVLRKEALEEPQGTGWYVPPSRAQYMVLVSGCNKEATYSVTCAERGKQCVAIQAQSEPAPPPRGTLVDEMRPEAVTAAERRGSMDLGCATATSRVLQEAPIQEPQGTGWYEPPTRARYLVEISGCGKQATYSIACSDRGKQCISSDEQSIAASSPPQDEVVRKMQAEAIKVAQVHGSSVLDCSAATGSVLQAKALLEPQTTGWYEPPSRAEYRIGVSGCGKRATYAVACLDRKRGPLCAIKVPE
jgi:predicted nucleic acid-binding Zn ribbon protein